MNDTVIDFMSKSSLKDKKIRHIHSTGKAYYDKIKDMHPELLQKGAYGSIVPYIDDMPLMLTAADLAITRSGAMTISELCRSSTPSILIPSPNVTANHQYKNAKYLQEKGAAILIEEKDLTSEKLKTEIFNLIDDKSIMKKMSQNAYMSYPENTDKLILNAILSITPDK